MADQYVIAGSSDPGADGTTEVVLARNNKGEVSKSVSNTQPAELSKSDLDTVKKLGLKVEKVTADRAQELAESGALAAPGADVVGSAPRLGSETDQE